MPIVSGSDLDVLVVYFLVLAVPGLLIALAAGLRGWVAAAGAPVLTFGLIGVAAPLVPASLSMPMEVWLGCASIAFLLAAILGRKLLRARRPLAARSTERSCSTADVSRSWSPWHHLGVAAAVGASTVIGARVVFRGASSFDAIPQWWDALFHASAIRFIADSGNNHPAALSVINQAANSDFYYPNGYHVLSAIVVRLSAGEVHQVINIGNALVVGLFSLGIAALIKQFGGRPALCASAAFLSCAFQSFPYDIIVWGPLFPYVMAVALVPAWLTILGRTLDAERRLGPAAALAIGAVGLMAVHPAAAIAAVILGSAMLVQRWLVQRRPLRTDLLVLLLAGGAALVLGVSLVTGVLGASAGPAVDWPMTHTPSAAVGDLLTQSRGRDFPPLWLIVLALAGLVAAASLQSIHWYLAGSAFFGVLFVMAAGYEGPLVALLTGPWWNDSRRMSALFTPAMIVLAAAGCVLVYDKTLAVLQYVLPPVRPGLRSRRTLFSAPALLVVLAFVFSVSQGLYQKDNASRVAQLYPDGPTVSSGERVALARLRQIVTDGALVMNDPQDGSAWMWALEGVRPVFGAAVVLGRESAQLGEERNLLLRDFNKLDSDAAVRAAVERLNIQYVYLGRGFLDEFQTRVPGLEGLDRVASLQLVLDSADAQIYRVHSAPLTGEPGPSQAQPGVEGLPS